MAATVYGRDNVDVLNNSLEDEKDFRNFMSKAANVSIVFIVIINIIIISSSSIIFIFTSLRFVPRILSKLE